MSKETGTIVTLLLSFVGLLLGTAYALIASSSGWLGGLLGALLGCLFGQLQKLSREVGALNQRLAASESARQTLLAHFDRVSQSIHERFVALEQKSSTAQHTETESVPQAEAAPELVVTTPTAIAETVRPAAVSEPIPPSPAAAPAEAEVTPLEAADKPLPAADLAQNLVESPGWEEVQPPRPAPQEAPQSAPEDRAPYEILSIDHAVEAAKRWLFGGNTLVRVGVVLLFLGLAFLLRYAAERTVIPLELRYAGVAACALALLVVGWRLRLRRPTYGVLLQGTAVAVMYLTTFSAMRLHPLIPVQGGFVLLVAVAALSALLAIRQDAASLAIVGTLGGFAAPILASTGSGNHVALFTYLLLLNAAVLSIAWFKAWRTLNVIGFVGTFGIASMWGARSFRPELFASTEPFLIAFFLMYVSIAILFARQRLQGWQAPDASSGRWDVLEQSLAQTHGVDGSLIFGAPLIGFGFQYALVKHMEFGLAFSALTLGMFYLILARLLFRRETPRYLLLTEVFLALGVVFASLAIPLALDARWTSAAWAVEGAGIYWVSLRQGRPLARLFALLLQAGAIVYFLPRISLPPEGSVSLLQGPWLGTLMLAASFLSNVRVERTFTTPETEIHGLRHLFSLIGLGFAFLTVPLLAGGTTTALLWSLGGLLTVWLALKLKDGAWMLAGIVAQLAAGCLFFAFNSAASADGAQVFAAGHSGLLICGAIGLAALCSVVLSHRSTDRTPEIDAIMGLVLIFSLVFINLAMLFILPWRLAAGGWATSGLLIVWLALRRESRIARWFGLALLVVGGATYSGHIPPLSAYATSPAFAHSGFWVPLVIALAAWIAIARIHVQNGSRASAGSTILAVPALLWGGWWWLFAWVAELNRLVGPDWKRHTTLIFFAITFAGWAQIARRLRWRPPAWLCLGLLPCGAFLLLAQHGVAPLAGVGAAVWGAFFAAHFLTVRALSCGTEPLWGKTTADWVHAGGAWLILATLSMQTSHVLADLGDTHSSWRWLGSAIVPAIYFAIASQLRTATRWPLRDHLGAYQILAAIPVSVVLLWWIIASNLFSNGSASPLPYLPLLNPLEIAYGAVLLTLWVWFRKLPANDDIKAVLAVLLPCIAFICYTGGTVRLVHHAYGVPFELAALAGSMTLQAGLSIAWSIAALALMVSGHQRQNRGAWILGAILVAVVVVKLFLIELSNQGGIERIVSFIGVGILLLIVGYFAPLPPRHSEEPSPAP